MDNGKCYYVSSGSTSFIGICDGKSNDEVVLKDAVICQRMRLQPQPGQIVAFYSFEPIDVMNKKELVVFTKYEYWFEITENSDLFQQYKKVMENWQIERSGLVQATPEQTSQIIKMPRKVQ